MSAPLINPASAEVGTFGIDARRLLPVYASGSMRPPAKWPMTEGGVVMKMMQQLLASSNRQPNGPLLRRLSREHRRSAARQRSPTGNTKD